MSIQNEKQKRARQLLGKKGVVSIGIGKKVKGGHLTKETAIIVGVEKKLPVDELKRKDVVPQKLGKYLTDVQEVGEIKLLENTGRIRPARPGCSIGHVKITAGTLGAIVRDRKRNDLAILSNNHVLACVNEGKYGDVILQPGAYDGGKYPGDFIAILDRFVPIKMVTGCWLWSLIKRLLHIPISINDVDCALASPIITEISPDVIECGRPACTPCKPIIGMTVIKSGRTTGKTSGKIVQVGAITRVSMGEGKVALFDNQIVISGTNCDFSAPGDSGSLIMNIEDEPVGLLFAGSNLITIGNEIGRVMEALNVDFNLEVPSPF